MIYILLVLIITFTLSPFDRQTLVDQANQLYLQGDYQDALSLYEKIDFKGPGCGIISAIVIGISSNLKKLFLRIKEHLIKPHLLTNCCLKSRLENRFNYGLGRQILLNYQ